MARLRYNNIGDSTGTISPITFSTSDTTTGTWSANPNIPTISADDYIAITVEEGTANQEIVYLSDYTNGDTSGDFTRGQEGTTGIAHVSTKWIHGPTTVDFLPVILLTHTGEPISSDGTFQAGQIAIDTGGVEYVCKTTGNPGTWVETSGSSSITIESTDSSITVTDTDSVVNLEVANSPAVGNITITGTPATGYVPTATSDSAATWQAPGVYGVGVISTTALSSSVSAALNLDDGNFFLFTGNPTGKYTINITNAPTGAEGQWTVVVMAVLNGSTAYLPSNITINGEQAGASSTALPTQGATNNGITTYYQGGSAWSTADASTYDLYTFTIIEGSSSDLWNLFLNLTTF